MNEQIVTIPLETLNRMLTKLGELPYADVAPIIQEAHAKSRPLPTEGE